MLATIAVNTNKPDRVWTTRIQVLGNLLPALFSVPFGILGVATFDASRGLAGWSLFGLAAFPIVGWLCLNVFGLYGNDAMRQALARRLDRRRTPARAERYFVGVARPSYRSLLDPHEDVGFLILHADRLEFFGDRLSIEVARSDLRLVGFRPNPHTWVGVGRWISLDGECEGTPIRLLVEPRERPLLVQNLFFGRRLRLRLADWLYEGADESGKRQARHEP